jgi:RNA polymerase sigma factor (sigma-70 family)
MDDRLEPPDPGAVTPSAVTGPGQRPSIGTPPRQTPPPAPVDSGFGSFYHRFVPTLVAFLLWQGARLSDAADIAQETMVAAHQHWQSIRHPDQWARRVASRTLIRRVTSIEEVPVDQIPDGTPLLPPQPNVATWEQQREILRVLAVLPPRQRQVMAWTFDGYSPSEIAEELQITPETVRSNLRKARRTLAAHLENTGETPR